MFDLPILIASLVSFTCLALLIGTAWNFAKAKNRKVTYLICIGIILSVAGSLVRVPKMQDGELDIRHPNRIIAAGLSAVGGLTFLFGLFVASIDYRRTKSE